MYIDICIYTFFKSFFQYSCASWCFSLLTLYLWNLFASAQDSTSVFLTVNRQCKIILKTTPIYTSTNVISPHSLALRWLRNFNVSIKKIKEVTIAVFFLQLWVHLGIFPRCFLKEVAKKHVFCFKFSVYALYLPYGIIYLFYWFARPLLALLKLVPKG